MKPAGIIQFADGTYHGGGTGYPNPKFNINAAKTYISPKKAESVLKQLQSNLRNEGARVLPVNITVAEEQLEEQWTVLHNHGEFAQGLFPIEEAAIAEVVRLTREDCPEYEGDDDEAVYYSMDGYYREVQITGA